jgi:hypothetical protein
LQEAEAVAHAAVNTLAKPTVGTSSAAAAENIARASSLPDLTSRRHHGERLELHTTLHRRLAHCGSCERVAGLCARSLARLGGGPAGTLIAPNLEEEAAREKRSRTDARGDRRGQEKKIKIGGTHKFGWEDGGPPGMEVGRGFGGVCKMEAYLEVLLELVFPPNLQILE